MFAIPGMLLILIEFLLVAYYGATTRHILFIEGYLAVLMIAVGFDSGFSKMIIATLMCIIVMLVLIFMMFKSQQRDDSDFSIDDPHFTKEDIRRIWDLIRKSMLKQKRD